MVASSFGTLRSLPPPLHARFDDPGLTLDGVDAVVRAWVDAVEGGTDVAERWPDWINIPSKVGQVAALRVAARRLRKDGPPGVLSVAVCPGLVDTARAPALVRRHVPPPSGPDEAAAHLLPPGARPGPTPVLHGELVQFGRVLPWR